MLLLVLSIRGQVDVWYKSCIGQQRRIDNRLVAFPKHRIQFGNHTGHLIDARLNVLFAGHSRVYGFDGVFNRNYPTGLGYIKFVQRI